MIECQRVLLARLLQRAQPLQFTFEHSDFTIQCIGARNALVQFVLANCQRTADFAQLALHGEWTARGLLATAQGAAVIAESVGQ